MNRLLYSLLSGRLGADLEIRILTRQTARAFRTQGPKESGDSASERLQSYARFSAEAAARARRDGQDQKSLQRDLYRRAGRLGRGLRRALRPRDEQECRVILRSLYRNIGITLQEERPGEFCIPHCYFSAFYTPEICALISALDAGLFAGIYGGGRLVFRKRLTQGWDCCRADFRKENPDFPES